MIKAVKIKNVIVAVLAETKTQYYVSSYGHCFYINKADCREMDVIIQPRS